MLAIAVNGRSTAKKRVKFCIWMERDENNVIRMDEFGGKNEFDGLEMNLVFDQKLKGFGCFVEKKD